MALRNQNLTIRKQLLKSLVINMEARGLTQKQLADLLGISQPRVSHLINGKIELFSVDSLLSLLGQLNVRVTLQCHFSEKKQEAKIKFVDPIKSASTNRFLSIYFFKLSVSNKLYFIYDP